MITTPIAIVGAGPAGSICAINLNKAGCDCLLIDRAEFPREKLCGGGLLPHAWQLLERIMPDLEYDYLTVPGIRLLFEGKRVNDYSLRQPVRVVNRRDFDNTLVQRYLQMGGQMITETLHTIEEQPDGLLLTMRSGEQVKCRQLIGADGSNSRVRHFLQPSFNNGILCVEQYEPLPAEVEPLITIELSRKFDNGYYYEFPNRQHNAVGYGHRATTVDEFRQLLLAHGYEEKQIRGAMISIHQDYPHHPRITLIGDAGGFADDVVYEGLYYAIATGYNCAEAIITGRPFEEVNATLQAKKDRKKKQAAFFYNPRSMRVVRHLVRCRWVTEWLLNRYFR